MKSAVVRLGLAALLFAGWIGYLVYLVVTLPRTPSHTPLIVSHPQILVSQLDVVAEVKGADGPVVVKEVLYPPQGDAQKLAGQEITVTNLGECRALPHEGQKADDVPADFTGPGDYLLPLQVVSKDKKEFEVTPTPASPGYPPGPERAGTPRIYPATRQVLAQYRAIRKPE